MSSQIRRNCPNCPPEKTASLSINTRNGLFHCFRCGYSGKIKGGNYYIRTFEGSDQVQVDKLPWPDGYRPINPDKPTMLFEKAALMYLAHRGVTPRQILDYKIGYTAEGRYAHRVIVPVVRGEELVYFVARSLRKLDQRRYLNPPRPKDGCIFKTYSGTAPVAVVCEGVFDALKVGLVAPAIALFSKNPTRQQLKSVAEGCGKAVLLLDADAHKDTIKVYTALEHFVACKPIFLKGFKDPGEMPPGEIEKVLHD